MRGGEGGGHEVAIRPDSRDEQSLGPVLSEALGTLDSSETKPFRKASTRLLNAIQNGRLLSLRTKNAVNSSTSDGASSKADSLNTKEKCPKKLSINANNKEQNIIEPNKSTSLTLLGPNNETSNSLEQQQSQSLSHIKKEFWKKEKIQVREVMVHFRLILGIECLLLTNQHSHQLCLHLKTLERRKKKKIKFQLELAQILSGHTLCRLPINIKMKKHLFQ
uniref:Uncharacterized protein n=1 Tax=Meloidogyne enterolobii TaxID=390850 RepID=A0A6V7WWE7_MELEN|nr:unnamed protein product [Meloidogyne enterolobii]